MIFALLIYRRLRKEKKLYADLDEKNSEIVDSINYAKTIQTAMLPWDSDLNKYLKSYFIIYKPKDIISGDFYWFKPLDDGYLIAVADCTGHGVPGSMISMMGSSILDEAVLTQGLKNTGEILTYLNTKMIEGLNKQVSENASRDGMDICLVRVFQSGVQVSEESSQNQINLQFSGAKRPLFILQNGKLETIKGDKNSIAGEKYLDGDYKFSSNEKKLETSSRIYLTSDGFVDQMSTNGKKFGIKRLKEILSENLSIKETNQKLEQEFTSHIGSEEQRDDFTIMGVEL